MPVLNTRECAKALEMQLCRVSFKKRALLGLSHRLKGIRSWASSDYADYCLPRVQRHSRLWAVGSEDMLVVNRDVSFIAFSVGIALSQRNVSKLKERSALL